MVDLPDKLKEEIHTFIRTSVTRFKVAYPAHDVSQMTFTASERQSPAGVYPIGIRVHLVARNSLSGGGPVVCFHSYTCAILSDDVTVDDVDEYLQAFPIYLIDFTEVKDGR